MKERSRPIDTVLPCKNRGGGFSMIELLIAMAILAIGMLAAVSMQLGSAHNNSKGNVRTQANMLAIAQLETLKNQDVSTLIPGAYSDPAKVDENGQPGGIYTRSWTIADLGVGARTITVSVQWEHRGRPASIIVSSNTKGNGV